MNIKQAIKAELRRVENDFGVKILLAVESGSRVWGFPSINSDYDVRFIYLHPPAWYLSVRERRDVIELPLLHDVLDINGWDLRKALALMGKSNPPLYEWLSSPMIYHSTDLAPRLRELSTRHFNNRSAIYHYLHMANGNYRDYLRAEEVPLKKYFYVLRPLLACQWIESKGGKPPLDFGTLLKAADLSQTIVRAISALLVKKKSSTELGNGPRNDEINQWIEDRLIFFSSYARTTAKNSNDIDDLDDFLFTSLYPQLGSKIKL